MWTGVTGTRPDAEREAPGADQGSGAGCHPSGGPYEPGLSYTAPFLKEKDDAARVRGLQLPMLEARDAVGLDAAFAALATERASALMVQTNPPVHPLRPADRGACGLPASPICTGTQRPTPTGS